MTEERFEDLVNLYLDNEIGRHELEELKRVIKENIARRKQFERACQLHQAARKALVNRGEGTASAAPEGRSSSGSRSSSRIGSPLTLEQMQERAKLNATVPVMAERQAASGAAATVKLSEVSTGRSRSHSRSSYAKTKSISLQGKLLLAGIVSVMAMGYFFFAPSIGNNDSHPHTGKANYTPNLPDLPRVPHGARGGGGPGEMNAPEGVDGQMVTAEDFIKARMMALAMTGNSVTGRMLPGLMTTQAGAVVTQGANGTQQFSYRFTQQIYVQGGNINEPPVDGQLQKTLGDTPAPGPTTPAPGPMTPPGAIIPEASSQTTESSITIVVPTGNAVPPLNNAKGNDTLGNDLKP